MARSCVFVAERLMHLGYQVALGMKLVWRMRLGRNTATAEGCMGWQADLGTCGHEDMNNCKYYAT